MGWRGRHKGGSGWGTHVNPWLIPVHVWQKPLQYCKVISLQLIKINGQKEKRKRKEHIEYIEYSFNSIEPIKQKELIPRCTFPKQNHNTHPTTIGKSYPLEITNPGFPENHRSQQFHSVPQLCLTLCDPVDCSTPGFPVHHQLPEPAPIR